MRLKIMKIKNNNLGIAGNIICALDILISRKNNELIFFDFKNPLYSNKINTWDKFFYQPFYEFNDLIEKKIKQKNFEIEYYKTSKLFKFGYCYNDDKIFYNTKIVQPLRKKLKKYIRFKDNVISKYKSFKNKNLTQNTLSVHLRGGDKFQERPWNKIRSIHNINTKMESYKKKLTLLNFSNFEEYIKKTFQTKECDKIFLATDDKYYLLNMKKKFKTLILPSYSKLINKYKIDTFNDKQDLGAHQLNVYEDEETKTRLGEEAIIDSIIMSKCKYSLLSKSNVSLLSILLRDDYNFSFLDGHTKYI